MDDADCENNGNGKAGSTANSKGNTAKMNLNNGQNDYENNNRNTTNNQELKSENKKSKTGEIDVKSEIKIEHEKNQIKSRRQSIISEDDDVRNNILNDVRDDVLEDDAYVGGECDEILSDAEVEDFTSDRKQSFESDCDLDLQRSLRRYGVTYDLVQYDKIFF